MLTLRRKACRAQELFVLPFWQEDWVAICQALGQDVDAVERGARRAKRSVEVHRCEGKQDKGVAGLGKVDIQKGGRRGLLLRCRRMTEDWD